MNELFSRSTMIALLPGEPDLRLPALLLLSLVYESLRNPAGTEGSSYSCPEPCFLISSLLNNDLLLLRVHSTVGRLCGHRNHRFPRRQRRREVMERPVGRHHRNSPTLRTTVPPSITLLRPSW